MRPQAGSPQMRSAISRRRLRPLAGFPLLIIFAALTSATASAQPKQIASRTSLVDGVKLHYLTAGEGPAVILLHGYTQTSRMWKPIIPLLAEKFTVIAPDLPGIGDSDIPQNGLDMKNAAIRIHGLAKSLGVGKARVVGHDIGLMVAYAFAAQYPSEVARVALMDAFLPGVGDWTKVWLLRDLWHFHFYGKTPLALVEGRVHDALPGVSVIVLTVIAGLTGRDELVSEQMLEVFARDAPRFVSALLSAHWLRRGDRERARRDYTAIPASDIPAPALLSVAATIVELTAEFGPSATAEHAAAALRLYPDLFVTGGAGAILVSGSVRTFLGIAAAAAGRPDDAVRELRLGIAADDQAGTPPFAALARFELATVLASRRRPGDVEEASALAASVADIAGQLGMAPLRARADALAASLRGDMPGPLTRREREVAAHIAQGLTNKQIAALMHISERTAESHVQHILGKLGLANRTHIATWARDGLRTDQP